MDVQGTGIVGFFHAVVAVPDMETSLAFYRDLLQGRVTYAWEHDQLTLASLTGYVMPSARAAVVTYPDDSEIELCEFRQPRGAEHVTKEWYDAGLSFVAFRVSDIDGVVRRLERAGVRFHSSVVSQMLSDGAIAKVVHCFAPEGTTVTLVELPGGRRSLAGANVGV